MKNIEEENQVPVDEISAPVDTFSESTPVVDAAQDVTMAMRVKR